MLLIAYDGSSDARAAIRSAGELMPGESATILTVWEPFINVINAIPHATPSAYYAWPDDAQNSQLDALAEKGARARAEEGVKLARAVGLNSQPRTKARATTINEAILAEADAVRAHAIVLGTRGLTGLKSLMLGSVSHAVTAHSHLPVMIVPSSRTAAHDKHGANGDASAVAAGTEAR
jgi:nucleotide-binding universal stress UspA family protein